MIRKIELDLLSDKESLQHEYEELQRGLRGLRAELRASDKGFVRLTDDLDGLSLDGRGRGIKSLLNRIARIEEIAEQRLRHHHSESLRAVSALVNNSFNSNTTHGTTDFQQ